MNLNLLLVQRSLLALSFFAGLGGVTKVQADGLFVAPPFVWDKHKDINEPAQKAIMVFDGGHEDLLLQVKYEGPVAEFGWLIPVPGLPTVEKGSMKCFYELSQYTQKYFDAGQRYGRNKSSSYGVAGIDSAAAPEPPVKVIEIKTVGAYEIAVLSTKDTTALEKWLQEQHFSIPTNATAIIDEYVQRHWFFVAAKVNLQQDRQNLAASAQGLSSGELNPLHIRFDTEQCVYPLKISAGNGRPTEVQVYVLSPEPLLERTMLEKKLPLIRSNDVAQAVKSAQNLKDSNAQLRQMQESRGGFALSSDKDEEKDFELRSKDLCAAPDELLPYAKVAKADLPECCREIPSLAAKPFWLTKQTWTFKPEEMQDLKFEAAIACFTEKLATEYGYHAAASLASFEAEAIPALLSALQNTNPVVRVNAANAVSSFDHGYESIKDARLTEAASVWLEDSEPKVRLMAVDVLTESANWNSKHTEAFVNMLRDPDAEVRERAAYALSRLPIRDDAEKYIPTIQTMLKDKNLNIRISAMRALQHFGKPAPREDLLQFFGVPDRRVVSIAFSQFNNQSAYELSNQEVIPLLCNSEPFARLLGLKILYQNANPESVELTLPLLKDAEPILRKRAAATLRAFSGQHFTEEQAADWEKWWSENKSGFVVQLHPEEMRPPRRSLDNSRAPNRASPPPSTP